MEPFMRSDHYHFIKNQARILVNGHATVNDESVLKALTELTKEKVIQLFNKLDADQKKLLESIAEITDKEQASIFYSQLKPYVIPFPELDEQALKKIFPKVKKLKVPNLAQTDLKETSYIRWYDASANKVYLIVQKEGKLTGVRGTLRSESLKSICTLCNGREEVALFMSESKKTSRGTSVKKGNYICRNSESCNRNIQALDKLHEFIDRLKAEQ